MVGGTVIEVCDVEDKVYVNCAQRPYGRIEECAIYVERNSNSEQIEIGDSIWWQGGSALWTPAKNRSGLQKQKGGVDYDIKIPRIGYSGVHHPFRDNQDKSNTAE